MASFKPWMRHTCMYQVCHRFAILHAFLRKKTQRFRDFSAGLWWKTPAYVLETPTRYVQIEVRRHKARYHLLRNIFSLLPLIVGRMWDYEMWGRGFDPPRLSRKKKKKKGIPHVQEPVKLTHLKTTMRAIRSLQIAQLPKKSRGKIGYWVSYLIGVPDIIWEICQV